MTTRLGNCKVNNRFASVRGTRALYGAVFLIVLFMGNLSAIIDAAHHPEIRYFDEEHLIVGGVTALVTTLLIIIALNFFAKLRKQENALLKLNAELEKRVEEKTRELTEAQEELLRREKLNMLGIVAGNVGNELRNPLGVMSNAVFYLSTVLTAADDSVREYLEIIRKEIDVAQLVLSDFSDFFRNITPKVKEVPVEALINQGLAGCIMPENVTVSVELPEKLPMAKVDPSQMRQVFQNLVTNAVQAMPEGGALRISGRFVGAGLAPTQSGCPQRRPLQDFVEIAVADSGTGISTVNISKVFEPLFSTKARGIGLGLPICRSFVEANGGRIEVESVLGQGTTFTVLLPIEKGEL